jgi:predicted MFS family arabinose efflux permease
LATWQLLALVFAATLCDVPGATARRSLIPTLTARARTPLERANAFAEAIPRLATLLGPPLAGVLIALLGATTVLYVDAATFALSALVVALAVPRKGERREAKGESGESGVAPAARAPFRQLWHELGEGFAFVWRDPLLRALTITSCVTNFFDAPFSLLLAVFVNGTTKRATDLGLLVATFGAGALVASLLFAAIGTRLPRRLPFALWMGGFAVVNGILALAPPLPVAFAALFAMGLTAGLVNPLSATIRAERVPEALRGRVFGLTLAASFAFIPLGRALGGYVAEVAGVQVVYAANAAAYVVILCVTLVLPAYRALDRARAAVATPRETLPMP